jgi:hypothetical protein
MAAQAELVLLAIKLFQAQVAAVQDTLLLAIMLLVPLVVTAV